MRAVVGFFVLIFLITIFYVIANLAADFSIKEKNSSLMRKIIFCSVTAGMLFGLLGEKFFS